MELMLHLSLFGSGQEREQSKAYGRPVDEIDRKGGVAEHLQRRTEAVYLHGNERAKHVSGCQYEDDGTWQVSLIRDSLQWQRHEAGEKYRHARAHGFRMVLASPRQWTRASDWGCS